VKLRIALVGAAAALFVATSFAVTARGNAAAPPLNLNGIWKTSDGDTVKLTQAGQGMSTVFRIGGPCPDGSERSFFIQGQLSGTSLAGQMLHCTKDLTLLQDCNLDDPWQTDFSADVSQNSISGTYRSQCYAWDDVQNGHRVNCHRDSSGDSDVSFDLTRVKCDPALFEKYKTASAQADAYFDAAGGKVSEAQSRYFAFLQKSIAESTEIGIVKGSLLYGIKKAGTKIGGKAATGAKVVVEVAEGVALIYTAYWLAHDVQPEIQDELLMLKESDGLLKQANQKAALALDDLAKLLANAEACEPEKDQVKSEQDFQDQVKAKVDEWELPGGYLYLDPSDPSRIPMDAGAAFKRAAKLLSAGGHRLMAGALAPEKKKRTILVPVKKVKAAIVQIDKGLAKMKTLNKWMKSRHSKDTALGTEIQGLLQHTRSNEIGG
jgi:hypothetical protein